MNSATGFHKQCVLDWRNAIQREARPVIAHRNAQFLRSGNAADSEAAISIWRFSIFYSVRYRFTQGKGYVISVAFAESHALGNLINSCPCFMATGYIARQCEYIYSPGFQLGNALRITTLAVTFFFITNKLQRDSLSRRHLTEELAPQR